MDACVTTLHGTNILFTLPQHHFFLGENFQCIETSVLILSLVIMMVETNAYLYTWNISNKHCANIEFARSEMRPCNRSSRSNGALYNLWHVRSCALSNQSQCSESNCTGTCIVNGSIQTINDSREGLG